MNLRLFGKTLQTLRKESGLTQQNLADKLQVSTDLISKWERGYQHHDRTWKPDRDQLIRLIYIFEDCLTEFDVQQWIEHTGYKFSSQELNYLIPPQKFSPYQAPPLPTFYIDRAGLQQQLQDQLNTTPALVLHGPGGVGKTSLAAWAGQSLVANFPDGVIWVDACNAHPIETTHRWLAHSLRLSLNGCTSAERTSELHAACRGKKYLLIIDDIQSATEIRHLYVVTPPARILLTTRNAKVADLLNAPILTVTGFMPGESYDFLRLWLPPTFDVTQLEPLVTRLGHLPLALNLSGAQLRAGISIDNLLTALNSISPGLSILNLSPTSNRNDSMIACFDLSYTALTPSLQHKFAQLCCLASPFPSESAAELWQVSLNEAYLILGYLLRLALIENKESQYQLPPLMRDYAQLKLAQWQNIGLPPGFSQV